MFSTKNNLVALVRDAFDEMPGWKRPTLYAVAQTLDGKLQYPTPLKEVNDALLRRFELQKQ